MRPQCTSVSPGYTLGTREIPGGEYLNRGANQRQWPCKTAKSADAHITLLLLAPPAFP